MNSPRTEGPFNPIRMNFWPTLAAVTAFLVLGSMFYFGIKLGNEKAAFSRSIEASALEADVRFRSPTMREIEAFQLQRGMAIAYVPIDGQRPYPIMCRFRGKWKARFFLGNNPRYPTSIFTGSSDVPHNNPVTRSCYELFGHRLEPEPEGSS